MHNCLFFRDYRQCREENEDRRMSGLSECQTEGEHPAPKVVKSRPLENEIRASVYRDSSSQIPSSLQQLVA